MHILVVDDEELARLRLIRLLEELPECEVIGEASNGTEAIEKIQTLDPELVFLDVRMPSMDGIAVAKALADYADPPAIVFCTAFDEYALEAFDTLAQGYIVKPVELQQLQHVIEKTKKLTRVQSRSIAKRPTEAEENSRNHISARTHKGVELVPFDNIYCFVAGQKYVTVVHTEGEVIVDDTLKDLELELAARFVRVHRNSLVAIDKIEALEKDNVGHYSLRMKETAVRPLVSRRHLAGVRKVLTCL